MLRINYQNNDTIIVVLHEIYGINKHIEGICKEVSKQGYDVCCPNLLKLEKPFSYQDEKRAYEYFMNDIGFTSAFNKVKELLLSLKDSYTYRIVVGYSIGATIAFISGKERDLCSGVIGFYGSRIRDYTSITTRCPTLLFFPEREKSFDVNKVIQILNEKPNVSIKTLEGQHGFSDPYNKFYVEESRKRGNQQMWQFIESIRSEG